MRKEIATKESLEKLQNELCAKTYLSSYTSQGNYVNFENVRNYFIDNGGANCNYYLLFATTGGAEIWYGIIDWRESYRNIREPGIISIYNESTVKPQGSNNIGTIDFVNKNVYYQVTPVGI